MHAASATLHFSALHCTTLHYTTLHYTTLHYTTLHNTTCLPRPHRAPHRAPTAPPPRMQVGARPPGGFCYRVLPCIVKTGDALLQEQFALQLVRDVMMCVMMCVVVCVVMHDVVHDVTRDLIHAVAHGPWLMAVARDMMRCCRSMKHVCCSIMHGMSCACAGPHRAASRLCLLWLYLLWLYLLWLYVLWPHLLGAHGAAHLRCLASAAAAAFLLRGGHRARVLS